MPAQLLRFNGAVRREPDIDRWLEQQSDALRPIAQRWFKAMRRCGEDVRELLHDNHPTACISDAAFGYVNAFTAHVNVGFFRGSRLADPRGLLQGTGKSMRHVKLVPGLEPDSAALQQLIEAAYMDMRALLGNRLRRGHVSGDNLGPASGEIGFRQDEVTARNMTPSVSFGVRRR